MKRFACALLVIAMLASLVVAPVAAQGETPLTPTDSAKLCTCGCGKTLDAVQWVAWDPNAKGHPVNGHYYLEADYTQSKQFQVDSGVRVILDLRGHKLTTQKGRLFLIYGYVAILDTVGGGRACAVSTGTANGGAVMLSMDKVAMNDALDGTLELYNCTMTLDTGNNGGNRGGLVDISSGAKMNVYGSRLINAKSNTTGGAIQVNASSSFTAVDSSIIGCTAPKSGGAIYSVGTVTLTNSLITGCEAKEYGGNIYVNGGKLTVENSKLENGISYATAKGGGNIAAVGGCTVKITDSTIRNGYAATYGGNVYFEKGTQTLTNVQVQGGVAGKMGGNLYCANADGKATLKNCNVSGDVYYGAGALTLTGTTKIGLNNYGVKTASGASLTTSGLTQGAEVYTQQQTETYLKAGYCPHCNQAVTWSEMTATPSGHCYLSADQTVSAAYEITGDTVVDLRGCDITSSDRAFTVAAGAALTLLDTVGGATVTGSGNADGLGGVISNAGTLRVYGGNYIYKADSAKPQTKGGVLYTGSATYIYGGVFDGSAFNQTASSCMGGALYMASKAGAFTMTAGRLIGGTAYRGGNVYISGGNTLTITGGSLAGGTATDSIGNTYIVGSSTVKTGTADISGLYITGGTSPGNGGNLGIAYYQSVQMRNCLLIGGTSGAKGGNIYFTTQSYATLTDCILLSGVAGTSGGNAHNNSNASTVTLVDCLLSDGSADNGGNFYALHGLITVKGGAYLYGVATTSGGNIYSGAGSLDDDVMILQANTSGVKPLIAGGSAGNNGGNVYNQRKLTLNAAFINNGKAGTSGSDLYHGGTDSNTMLTIGEGLTGNIRMSAASGNLGQGIFGKPIAKTAATAFGAKLVLENVEGNPQACAYNGQLYVGGATVKTADGSEVWYMDSAEAMAACPQDGWVKLYTEQPLVMTKDCCVDLNGKTVSVSGEYTLYGMDSSGDEYKDAAGRAQWASADVVKTAVMTDAPNGKRYMAITEDGSVSYHRLEMQLTTVTIRTSNCGVYYKGTWGCDSVLQEKIAGYGVAVSLKEMPKADFAKDDNCLYVTYGGNTLSVGETKTGVIIKNIMRVQLSAATNASRGEMPIYATAYVQLTDGTIYVGDRPGSQDDVAYSLRTTMERMDQLIISNQSLFLRSDVQMARDFYAQWRNRGMQDWSFTKLEEPKDDGVLKIIILGSSRSVNTFHLLYEAFKDQMPDQELVLGVMYYSGCSMTMHKNFIQNDSYVYHYYRNDNGRWTITPGMNMDSGLRAENWDVILLQAGTGDQANQMNLSTRTFLKEYIDEHVIDPYELWWHSTWFNSTDPDLYFSPKTPEDAAAVDQIAQLTSTNNAAKNYVLDDPMFSGHIASGTPVMYALKVLGVAEKDLYRDHTHLYDFGCLLVAYSFYAQYTGKPVTQINLNKIPAYLRYDSSKGDLTLTDEMKNIILESVAYTMQDPWSVPGAE